MNEKEREKNGKKLHISLVKWMEFADGFLIGW